MITIFAKHSVGRVLLHLTCLLRDGKLRWHWSGIAREIRRPAAPRFYVEPATSL